MDDPDESITEGMSAMFDSTTDLLGEPPVIKEEQLETYELVPEPIPEDDATPEGISIPDGFDMAEGVGMSNGIDMADGVPEEYGLSELDGFETMDQIHGSTEEMLTDTDKQIQEIIEENDERDYTESYEKYTVSESADKAAINAIVHKQRSNSTTYSTKGFQVVEFFPRKNYFGYFIILDGHRFHFNSRSQNICKYRCRFFSKGCGVRLKIEKGVIQKINEHDHSNVFTEDDNYHFKCVYCLKDFTDLEERKNHILKDRHNNAPWPMDEKLCVFADYDIDKLTYRSEWDEPDPIDRLDNIENAQQCPLPNKLSILDRVFINNENLVGIFKPGENDAPYYPPETIINPKSSKSTRESTSIPVPAKTPKSNKSSRESTHIPIPAKTPKSTKPAKESISSTPTIRTRTRSVKSPPKDININTLNTETTTETKTTETNITEDSTTETSTTENTDSAPTVESTFRITNIASKSKKRRKESLDCSKPKKSSKIEDENISQILECSKPKKNIKITTEKIPQRIDNVIEEYENKVVLFCDICNVQLSSLKDRADHDQSAEHQENKRHELEAGLRQKISLSFEKDIFTKEFLSYNKALEAELRTLRKGAVDLEEQNAVLTSHIKELKDVVSELSNAKALMQRRHSTLETHLQDLKGELSKVFSNVLCTEVSHDNFNETFNKLSMAITGKKPGNSAISYKLKKNLTKAHIDTIML